MISIPSRFKFKNQTLETKDNFQQKNDSRIWHLLHVRTSQSYKIK